MDDLETLEKLVQHSRFQIVVLRRSEECTVTTFFVLFLLLRGAQPLPFFSASHPHTSGYGCERGKGTGRKEASSYSYTQNIVSRQETMLWTHTDHSTMSCQEMLYFQNMVTNQLLIWCSFNPKHIFPICVLVGSNMMYYTIKRTAIRQSGFSSSPLSLFLGCGECVGGILASCTCVYVWGCMCGVGDYTCAPCFSSRHLL